jgi:8-oxo-dGTP diphosphatase
VSEPRAYPTRPFLGVGVVVFHGQRVLLIRRARPPSAGSWSLPGGAVELGESTRDAARREIMEETGVAISEPVFVETIDIIRPDEQGRIRYHYVLLDFMAEAPGEHVTPGDEALEARWFAPDEYRRLELWSETLRVIERAATLRAAAGAKGSPSAAPVDSTRPEPNARRS